MVSSYAIYDYYFFENLISQQKTHFFLKKKNRLSQKYFPRAPIVCLRSPSSFDVSVEERHKRWFDCVSIQQQDGTEVEKPILDKDILYITTVEFVFRNFK